MLLTIDVRGGFGGAVVYSVEVRVDGTIFYRGDAGVDELGERRGHVTTTTLDEVVRAMDAYLARPPEVGTSTATVLPDGSTEWDFEDSLVCSDTSRTTIGYHRADRHVALEESHCERTALGALEEELRRILAIERWTE